MSNHLAANDSRLVRGKNVLEFGAGAGVPGLAAGVLGAKRVVLTDYPSPELLQNLEGNVKRNAEVHNGLEGRVVVQGHVWGKGFEDVLDRLVGGGSASNVVTTTLSPATSTSRPSPATSTTTTTTTTSSPQASNPAQPPNLNKFQTLLLSDLIFNHSQHIPLLRSLEALIDPPSGVALVFHSHHLPQHRARDLRFFTLAEKRGWTVDNVVEEVRGVQFEKDGGDVSLRERVWGREMRWDGVVREETSDDEDDEDDV